MFNSFSKERKLALHFIFWISYYILFSLIWARNGNYKDSFYLEFILLPMRALAVYITILYLIPNYLLNKRFVQFIFSYSLLIGLLGFLQLVFMNTFYSERILSLTNGRIDLNAFIRAVILINSTVFFVSTFYILNLYFTERNLRIKISEEKADEVIKIELKSNRRNYQISSKDIIYIEGLGNYINYHLENGKKITVYQSLKKCLATLPNNFIRVHKSYIINKNQIVSYGNESIETSSGQTIPLGNSFDSDSLGL